jgi:hypothetical protein
MKKAKSTKAAQWILTCHDFTASFLGEIRSAKCATPSSRFKASNETHKTAHADYMNSGGKKI